MSCNPFFIDLGLRVGGKRIASMAREIGFSRAAQFTDDIKTQSGTLPDDAELSLDTAVANFSFGQGSLTATPIQVAQMICTCLLYTSITGFCGRWRPNRAVRRWRIQFPRKR